MRALATRAAAALGRHRGVAEAVCAARTVAAGGRRHAAGAAAAPGGGAGEGTTKTTTSSDGLRKSFSETRVVGFPVDIIYSVVSDVEKYHNFVPFCLRSHVIEKTQTSMTADLEIGFGPISERYRSNVTLEPRVSVRAKSENTVLFRCARAAAPPRRRRIPRGPDGRPAPAAGPARSHGDSSGHCTPGPLPTTTALSFHVDFGFRSPLYRQAVDVVFDQVVVRIIGAFERRCRSVYGPPVRLDGGARGGARERRTGGGADEDRPAAP